MSEVSRDPWTIHFQSNWLVLMEIFILLQLFLKGLRQWLYEKVGNFKSLWGKKQFTSSILHFFGDHCMLVKVYIECIISVIH